MSYDIFSFRMLVKKVSFYTIIGLVSLKMLACGENTSTISTCQKNKGIPILDIKIAVPVENITRATYLKGTFTQIDSNACETNDAIVSIKGRGNTSWSFPKRSYQIKLDSAESILGLNPGKKFILQANYSDKTMLRNKLAFYLSKISSLAWTPKSKFIELYINNNYRGIYLLIQKIEISENSLHPNSVDALIEIDKPDRLHAGDIYFETNEHLFCIKDFSKDSIAQFSAIQKFVTAAEKSILDGHNYNQYFNLLAMADWYIINEIAKNNDALFKTSVYFHFKLGGTINMGPVWDYDIAFGNIDYNGNDSIQGFYMKKAPYFEQLFKQPDFLAVIKERYAYFYEQKNTILDYLDTEAVYLKHATDSNFTKWPILGKYIWPNNYIGNTYGEEVDYLKFWLNGRMDWLNNAYMEM